MGRLNALKTQEKCGFSATVYDSSVNRAGFAQKGGNCNGFQLETRILRWSI